MYVLRIEDYVEQGSCKDNKRKEMDFDAGITRYKSLLLKLAKDKTLDIITSFEGTKQDDLKKNAIDMNVLERAHLVKGHTKETNHNVYCQYELTPEGVSSVEKLSKESLSDKEPHQPHTLGAPASQEIPLGGVEPNQSPCPDCGKPFKTHSEMERHRDTTHHETKGHE